MRSKLAIAAIAALSWSAQGQTLLVVTNARLDVANDPAYTLTGPAGTFRITYNVTAGGTPINLNDGSTFRQYVWASDGHLVQSNANSTTPEVSLDNGQTKYLMNTLGAGTYRVRVIATPVSGDTNASWNVAHHWLTVTASVAAAATVNINSGAVQVAALTVDLISINSASISNAGDLWIGGTLTAGGLNVTGAVAVIDTGAVRKVGGELTGGLTNRSAGGFVGNGAGLTNLPPASVASLDDVGDVSVSGVSAGQILSFDGTAWTNSPNTGGYIGSIQLVTNASGQVGYTNRVGIFTALPGFALPGGNNIAWTYISDYSTDSIVSNRNIGSSVTYYATNNTLAGVLANESAGLRQIDYRPVTSGVWVRAAVEWIQRPQRGKGAGGGGLRSGISYLVYGGNTNFLFGGQKVTTTTPVYKHKFYTAAFSLQGDVSGNAPYDVLANSFNLEEHPQAVWDAVDYDGTGVVRGFFINADGVPSMLQLVTNAAFASSIQGFAIGLHSETAATGRGTNVMWQVRRFLIQEGALWIDPSSRL